MHRRLNGVAPMAARGHPFVSPPEAGRRPWSAHVHQQGDTSWRWQPDEEPLNWRRDGSLAPPAREGTRPRRAQEVCRVRFDGQFGKNCAGRARSDGFSSTKGRRSATPAEVAALQSSGRRRDRLCPLAAGRGRMTTTPADIGEYRGQQAPGTNSGAFEKKKTCGW